MAETSAEEHRARLRRIGFRSWHRGIREMDLILGHFSDNMLESLSFPELDQYEALLEAEDTSLYNWITGREPVPAEHDTPLLARIRTFNHMKGTLWVNRSEG
ncbi:MAG: succinate dehydrogenase assembly factor 2 [Parvibaculum sp.]|nr:succinate dehydrogenase assembly factor 2 [Parvibaculum sp.]